jgi:hypothetical protein
MTTPVINPSKGFQIAQGAANFVAEGVTAATVQYGTVEGGPYPATFTVPPSLVAADEASGTITVPLPAGLAFGTYYGIATVTNAAGASAASNEAAWTLQPTAVPAAPTFSIA